MNKKGLLHSSLVLRQLLFGFTILVGTTTTTEAKTILNDTIPLRDRTGDYLRDSVVNPFNLNDPTVIKKTVELDPLSNRYFITEKVGDEFYYRAPTVMTYDEYLDWKAKTQERDYFERLAGLSKRKGGDKIDPMSKIDFSATQNSKLKMLLKSVGVNGKLPEVPKLDIKKMGDNLIGMIFGDPPTVDIRPQGQIDLTLGGDYRYYGNPILPTYARTSGGLLFNMDINMNVTGKIGEKLNLNTAFNNKATFDFDNLMKIKYNSNVFSEDDIIKSIEGGNVSLPLRGTLIQGSQNLFGVKTELQFGYLRLTALAAQQKNRRQNLAVQGGSQVQNFNVPIDQYDENRHFFLTHFNRNTFEKALKELPLVNSLFSIDKIEVWVSNERNEDKEVRQIVALADLGEPTNLNNPQKIRRTTKAIQSPLDNGEYLPDNEANDLYPRLKQDNLQTRTINTAIRYIENTYGLVQGQDFVKRSAKRLQPSEYQFNPKLGTLSINNVDRQQVLGVSFSYFYNGKGPYQVGEFGQDVPAFTGGDPNNPNPGRDSVAQVLFVKLLKNTIQSPTIPLYDLMMKNVYSVGAYVTNPQDLRLDILYQDVSADKADKRSLPELSKVPLLTVLNLDRLNQVGDPQPDGQFDFIPDVTINTRNGRIMFPKLEPFGSSLTNRLTELGMDPSVIGKYIYQELYDSTLFRAQERQEKNRFLIRGQVKSTASNRIQLNAFGLRPGAVTVTAGSFSLLEGVDYAIDYGTSTLTILNPAYVAPNIPLNVSYEDNALFGFQTRTMLGLRADYKLNKNFNIGATFMNLFEIPYTRKVNFGDDPINNKVYGADINFTEDAPWLTKLVDKLPFIETKEPSKITVSAEGALLKPGHSKAIEGPSGDCQETGGIVYLDDFEGSSSPFSLMSQPNAWQISSVPQKNRLFPEASADGLTTGVNRALLNWYRIDQFVLEKGAAADKTDPCTAPIGQTEVFPNRDPALNGGFSNYLPTFDLTYYPNERGPYNFDSPPNAAKTPYSAGIRGDGNLNAPETRWAGIMRGLTTTDFEQANVEYVDFWLLDPFLKPGTSDNAGNIYIHLGDISEDILKDSRKSYENGLPSPENPDFKVDKTIWGIVPRTEIPLPNSFSASNAAREAQDVGLDGMTDAQETDFYKDWLSKFSPIPAKVAADPSNDDFTYYNDETAYPGGTPVLNRYKKFNGLQGNAASNAGTQIQSATNLPDAEDVNRDNSFEENEAYFSYKIPISRDAFSPLTNKYYIENTVDAGGSGRVWHHFRVPIDAFDSKHGAISDFRSIRFMRLIVKDFPQQTCLRFGKLDLIRNQWRRYKRPLSIDGVDITNRADNSAMELVSVNLEENSKKLPFNYVIPPCISREVIPNAFAANAKQNEQALGIRMLNLLPNVPRAAFKLFSSDMRIYERLKMFVHAEQQDGRAILNDKMSIFMRIGSDFERNYYEYEIPLKMSDLAQVGTTSSTTEDYKKYVWLPDNKFDFPLSLLTKIKVERNAKNADLSKVYSIADPENTAHLVKVIGNPDIGSVKGIMVGVYNKDRVPHDLELWLNELRMTGLNENAGGAAIARVDMKMADFGNLSLSGNYLGVGYGAIDQRVTQRSREQVLEYAVNGNFEVGKFFNPKIGLHIPFNVQYSNNTRTPEYDPYDLDIKLKDKLLSQVNGEERAKIKDAAQTVQVIKGYSFNNVRKDRTGASDRKPAPWDIENFAVSYANTSVDRHDPLVESDAKETKKGSLDYTYSREPLYVTPFKKLIKNPSVEKYVKLITEMNFNPIPNNVGFNTILDRQLNITKYRFSGGDEAYNTFYMRRFSWDRNYNMQWDLTRALKLNFDAKNFAIIDELPDYDSNYLPVDEKVKQKYLNDNLKNFGRTKRYDHNINVNYTVPTRNIPYLEWVQLRGTYTSSYGWEAGALGFETIGNNINNKQSRQVNADMNFTQLYNQFKYLKKIQEPLFKPQTDKAKKARTKPGLNVENIKTKIPETTPDSTRGKKKKKEKTEYEPSGIEKIVIRPLLLLRNARLNYTEQFNSFVPGFTPQARLFGMSDLSRPGWDYVLGYRQADENWLNEADAPTRNWLSRDIRQLRPTLNNYSQQIDARLTVEPFTDFRVDIDLNKNYVKNQSQEFRDTTGRAGPLVHTNRFDEGSYNISYFTLNTLFTNTQEVFKTFSDNREKMSQILGAGNSDHPDFKGYKLGFGPTNQDVVVPAFIAAYTGKDISTSNKNIFNERPSLNWRLSYNGLAKLPGLKNTFNNISITHGYKSSLTVNSYRTSQFYDITNLQKPRIGSPYEYYSQYDMPVVAITEQFSPLLGIDMSFKSGANFGLQYRKSRNLALSLSDTRLQETKTSEFQIKFGHRIKNVYIKALDFNLDGNAKKKPVKKKDEDLKAPSGDATADPKAKKKKEPKAKKGNDLVLNFDLSFRDDITENHLLGQGTDVPSRGSQTLRVSPSATYTLNKRLDLRFYVDYNRIIPYTTAAFPSTTATGGFVVTFKLN